MFITLNNFRPSPVLFWNDHLLEGKQFIQNLLHTRHLLVLDSVHLITVRCTWPSHGTQTKKTTCLVPWKVVNNMYSPLVLSLRFTSKTFPHPSLAC